MSNDSRTPGTPLDASEERAHFRECRLTVLDGPALGATHVFSAARAVAGTAPGADFVIDAPAISKFHCEVRVLDGSAFVRDLGSRSGTFIDHVQVLDAPLPSGSILKLGSTSMRFDFGSRRVAIPLSTRDQFGSLQGTSVAMRAVYARIEAAAAGDSPVLLQGESGTGKDLAAESIHFESGRRAGPFIILDCGALPSNLIEAELFGHEAGAFTGVTVPRMGAFESAHGGTLLLNEIGELALELQPKLLCVLDRNEVQRIGSTRRRPLDVRIVAATSRNLQEEVNGRRFCADLYSRLAVLVITMPPLRERIIDIPVLVEAILGQLGDREIDSPLGRSLRGDELLAELACHSWPGNVRELRDHVESYLRGGQALTARCRSTEPSIDTSRPLRENRERWVHYAERRYLGRLLAVHGDNVSAAARAAGIDRVHFHRLLKRAGVARPRGL